MNDPIISTALAAAACGKTDRRIRQLIREGRIRNWGSPRRIMVRLSEVLDVAGDPLGLS